MRPKRKSTPKSSVNNVLPAENSIISSEVVVADRKTVSGRKPRGRPRKKTTPVNDAVSNISTCTNSCIIIESESSDNSNLEPIGSLNDNNSNNIEVALPTSQMTDVETSQLSQQLETLEVLEDDEEDTKEMDEDQLCTVAEEVIVEDDVEFADDELISNSEVVVIDLSADSNSCEDVKLPETVTSSPLPPPPPVPPQSEDVEKVRLMRMLEDQLDLSAVSVIARNQTTTITTVAIKKKNTEHKSKEKTSKKTNQTRHKLVKIPKTPTTEIPFIKNSIDDEGTIRRSSRIKSISNQQQQKSKGLVKSTTSTTLTTVKTDTPTDSSENSNNSVGNPESEKSSASSATASPSLLPSIASTNSDLFESNKPVKVKSRWRRSSELEMNVLTPAAVVMESQQLAKIITEVPSKTTTEEIKPQPPQPQKIQQRDEEVHNRLKQFVHIKENQYLTDRQNCKETKDMLCDCFLSVEEVDRGEYGCGEDCLNRLLMIECGTLCPIGERCTNNKIQKGEFASVEVFKTDKKGLGLRATANIPYGEFILEYVGEVIDANEFDFRVDNYSNDKITHYYFMSLRADAIIDATRRGNISRFINHSCEPNAETQKWTVNGELRIGFFCTRTILAGEEITFDYRYQRYGKEAQKCYCEAPSCRGWLGEEPDDDEDDEEDEEDAEDEEDDENIATAKKDGVEKKSDENQIESVKTATTKKRTVATKTTTAPKVRNMRLVRKPRSKDMFDDLDLDDEIEMLLTTGLKNQAHTLRLSRLVVRAKETIQRAKLIRILRRGELPCRRLFLDYHGLKLMHGYMMDAEKLVKADKQFESFRLELLQTLATLPIQSKTTLQDSKVLATVEMWSKKAYLTLDSIENTYISTEMMSTVENRENPPPPKHESLTNNKVETPEAMDIDSDTVISAQILTNSNGVKDCSNNQSVNVKIESNESERNYEEEIMELALKLLDEWSSLKEMFKIPKKERIEQMKEHEREANRGYIAGQGLDNDAAGDHANNNDGRYRLNRRAKSMDKTPFDMQTLNQNRGKNHQFIKMEDGNTRLSTNNTHFGGGGSFGHTGGHLGKYERRKMFALQVEQREDERRRKHQEFWRQHEQQCILFGTDPRFTAPFDPSRGYQCIWNPQMRQWQNYPLAPGPGPVPFGQMPPNMMGHMPTAASATNPYMLPPTLPYQNYGGGGVGPSIAKNDADDIQNVKFLGPIPPPVKLPPKWKCAKDKYGRPYYYHIKIRKAQWEPPPNSQPQLLSTNDESSSVTSSSDTSSLSSDTSSEDDDDDSDNDDDDDLNDGKLLLSVRKSIERQATSKKSTITVQNVDRLDEDRAETIKTEEIRTDEMVKPMELVDVKIKEEVSPDEKSDVAAMMMPPLIKKRRSNLVQEIIISPRSESDRQQFKEDMKRYRNNKEKLKKHKDLMQQHNRKNAKERRKKTIIKLKMKEMTENNNEHARRIKETFRSQMATVVVTVLNAYRKPDCKDGRITNTEDFKHLARKLTHFVMLKEMKHIDKIEELTCTENVKGKAREYIRKYMSKFGEVYQKRDDEPDY